MPALQPGPDAPRFASGQILDAVPMFPLPDVVFFPHALLPLHVFEPRYRDLVAYALAGSRLIAVPQLAPGWQDEYLGAPAVQPVMGLGWLMRHEPMDDGRSNILLRGLHRVRLLDEEPRSRGFRLARVEVIDGGPDAGNLEPLLPTVRQLFATAADAAPGLSEGAVAAMLRPGADPDALLDAIAAALPLPTDARQELLGLPMPSIRAARLLELIADFLADHDAVPPPTDELV